MKIMAALIILCLCAGSATAAIEGFPVNNIMFEMEACASALRYACFLPGSIVLCPIFTLCFPITCPFACRLYLIYRIPDYLLPLGGMIMLAMTCMVPDSEPIAKVAVFIPSICFTISSALNALLAYPLTQTMGLLCPISALPVLCCTPVHQSIFSAFACLTPFYYQILFPRITALRVEISQKLEWIKSPLCGALLFNIEHIPSYTAYPDLYCLLCGCPFRCLQSAATPLFCLSSVLCCPVILPSSCVQLFIILPTTCLSTREFFRNDLPRLINPQNTCLPTYSVF